MQNDPPNQAVMIVPPTAASPEEPNRSGPLIEFVEGLAKGAAEGAFGLAIAAGASGGDLKTAIAYGLVGGVGKFGVARAYEWATKARRIEPLLPKIEAAAAKLKNAGAQDADVNDYAKAAAEAYSSAYDHTADHRKQKVIAAALVNAFLPEVYESGLTLTLFKLLEDLDYGDLFLLANVCGQGFLQGRPGFDEFNTGTMNRYHLDRLLQHSLLNYPSTLGHGVNVRDVQPRLRVTELGTKLQKLMTQVAEGEALFPAATKQ